MSIPFTGAVRLTPVKPPSRPYWENSASAWLTDWVAESGVSGIARVGWPVPSDVAAVQLLKAAALDVIRDSGLANPLSMAWEPGVVYVKDEITTQAIPTFGVARDRALYAVQQCLSDTPR